MIIKGNFVETKCMGQLHCCSGYMELDKDGAVQGISQELPSGYEGQVLDYGDCLILQSFADIHLHAPQYPMMGMGMNLPLLDWLDQYTFPLEARCADLDYARAIYGQLAKELIQNGTTQVVMFSSIHTEATLILMEELEKVGVTGFVGKVNMDRNGGVNYQETTEDSMVETMRFIEESRRFENLKPVITPRFTPCCTDELMGELGRMAEAGNLAIQSHLSENNREIAWVQELHPDCQQYWETYAKYGLWNEKTIMAHCVYSDARERAAMKTAGVLVAHCPNSNVNISSGIAPIWDMVQEGVQVGLGSDIAGGDEISMFKNMAAAVKSSKSRALYNEGQPLNPTQAYYMATSASQGYFGRGKGFAVGEKLHAVVVRDSILPNTGELSLQQRLDRAIHRTEKDQIVAVFSQGRDVLPLTK
ncbi:MAG: amidohydrolase family protein [Eubacteriales bacterium]